MRGAQLNYENVKLWFAHKDGNIVTIDEINEENKNDNYSCTVCGSELKPKAIKSKQVSSHFAHIDSSKCNSETMIHWWFKHKFLEVGDTFTVVSDKERQYIVKQVMVEQSIQLAENTYKPDVTIHTECGNTIYFEMAFSNKKKVKDYLDIWLDLKNIVVEIDIKQLMLKDEISKFNALFYDGKCFNTKKNDTYYNTIGKYKEEKLKGKVDDELKERIRKLDWFWDDIARYNNGEVDIEHMSLLIENVDFKDQAIINTLLRKSYCSKLSEDLKEQKILDQLKPFENSNEIGEFIKNAVKKLNMKYKKTDERYGVKLDKETHYYYKHNWYMGRKRKVSRVSHYTYAVSLRFKNYKWDYEFPVKSVDVTNRLAELQDTEIIMKYIDENLKYHTITIPCVECLKNFTMERGEIDFFISKNLSLPKRCKKCRDKRK